MMVINYITLAIVVFSVEIKCQRNIIGSRLLQFNEPIAPIASNIKELRGSKQFRFDEPVTPNTSTTEQDEPVSSKTSTIEHNQEVNGECIPLDKCASLDWLVENLHTASDLNLSSSDIIENVKNRICGFYGRIPKVLCPMEDENTIEDTQLYEADYDYTESDVDSADETKIITPEEEPSEFRTMELLNGNMKKQDVFFNNQADEIENKSQITNLETFNTPSKISVSDEMIGEEWGRIGGVFNKIGVQQKQKCRGSLLIRHGKRNAPPLEDFKQLRLKGKSFRQMRKLRARSIIQMQTQGNCCWKLYSKPNFRGIEESFYNSYNIIPQVHPRSIKAHNCW